MTTYDPVDRFVSEAALATTLADYATSSALADAAAATLAAAKDYVDGLLGITEEPAE